MEFIIGMTFDVITITAERPTYDQLYQKGSTGVVIKEYPDKDIGAIIGYEHGCGSWLVPKGEYKKVGRLTIKSIKKGA
jgi:hypothetical protein